MNQDKVNNASLLYIRNPLTKCKKQLQNTTLQIFIPQNMVSSTWAQKWKTPDEEEKEKEQERKYLS